MSTDNEAEQAYYRAMREHETEKRIREQKQKKPYINRPPKKEHNKKYPFFGPPLAMSKDPKSSDGGRFLVSRGGNPYN